MSGFRLIRSSRAFTQREPGSAPHEHLVCELIQSALCGYTDDVQTFLRILPLLICLFGGAGPLAGCRKQSGPSADAIKQSLASYTPQFAELKRRYMDLRERVDSIPMDLEGFGEARARFYAAEEARGITEARIESLQSRLDAAVSAGNREELQEISTETARIPDDIRKVDDLHTKMLHEMMRFERIARQQQEARATAASNPAPAPAPAKTKTKRSKANQ